jgi:hypothetical protein
MAQLIDLGKLRFSLTGTWSSSNTYEYNDIVRYGGNLYVWTGASDSISTDVPGTAANWQTVVEGLKYLGAWSSSGSYKVGEVVVNGAKLFLCLKDASSSFNNLSNATYWAQISDGIQYEAAYSGSSTYQKNDVVTYGAYVYIAKAATVGNAPTDTSFWDLLLAGVSYKGAYNSGTTYLSGELVTSGGSAYIAKSLTVGNAPTNATYWDLFADGTYPNQTGNVNYVLKTSGSAVSWTNALDIASVETSGDVTVGGDLSTTGTATSEGVIYGGATAQQSETDAGYSNPVAIYAFDNGSEDAGFGQLAFKNFDRTSSTDMIVYSNNGNDLYGWASFGITGDSFGDPGFPLTGANDAYIFHEAPLEITFTVTSKQLTDNIATIQVTEAVDPVEVYPGSKIVVTGVDATFNGTYKVSSVDALTNKISYAKSATNVAISAVSPSGTAVTNGGGQGNLVFATGENGSDNKIVFAAGGFATGNTQMEITPDVNVHIEIPTPSISPTTGALTVVGGVGIQGDMNIQGEVNIVGNLTFGGGTTTTANLAVSNPLVFVGDGTVSDTKNLGLIGQYPVSGSASVRTVTNKVLTSNVATLTTGSAHDYNVGDIAVVTGVDATFNGTFAITAVTLDTFSYAKTATNVATTAVSPAGSVSVSQRIRYSGIVRDNADNVFKVFTGATTKPVSTVNFSEAGLAFADVKVKNIDTVGTITGSSASNITINTNKFVVAASTGNTTVGGTLGATNLITASGGVTSFGTLSVGTVTTNFFTVDNTNGNTLISGTLGVTGNTTLSGTLVGGSASNIAINTNRFTVNATTGATVIAGTLGVGSTLNSTGTFTVNTNQFSVDAANGNTLIAGTLGVTGNTTVSGNLTVTGRLVAQEMTEDIIDVSHSANVVSMPYTSANTFWVTNSPSANMTWNVTSAPTDNGKSFVITGLVTQPGGTGWYPATIQVDGVAQTLKWWTGTVPSASTIAGRIDIFNFTFIRRGNAWTVLGSSTVGF